jgi:UDP:flavonoid glycosyltransferase YjiC (YdhE family)
MDDAALLGAIAGRRSFDLVDPWYSDIDLHPDTEAPTVGYPRWEPTHREAAAIPPGGAPLVVVTLGTALPLDPDGFYLTFVEAIRALPVRAVLLGARRNDLQPSLPDQLSLAPFAPLSQLLPQASLVVHHGGTGTSHAAVAHGCPSLVVPRCFDQRYQAQRLVAVGAAHSVPWRDLTVDDATEAIRDALADDGLTETSRALAAQIRSLPSPAVRIADALQASELVP